MSNIICIWCSIFNAATIYSSNQFSLLIFGKFIAWNLFDPNTNFLQPFQAGPILDFQGPEQNFQLLSQLFMFT